MKGSILVAMFAGLTLSLGACSPSQFQTLKIFDSPSRMVALRVMPDAYEGKGYDHPVSMTKEDMTQIMQGVRVNNRARYNASSPKSSHTHPAFSESEIHFFAPLIVRGLNQATPEEMVTFVETAEIETNDLERNYQLTTSGGFYVAGGNLHVILSNFSVKAALWQDAAESENGGGSIHTNPLEQLDPRPGHLLFEPRKFMVASPDGEIGSMLKGKPWQVTIRHKELLGTMK
jgi:hypothetical protein